VPSSTVSLHTRKSKYSPCLYSFIGASAILSLAAPRPGYDGVGVFFLVATGGLPPAAAARHDGNAVLASHLSQYQWYALYTSSAFSAAILRIGFVSEFLAPFEFNVGDVLKFAKIAAEVHEKCTPSFFFFFYTLALYML